ncbi:hypothetical protein F4054_06515 [Candidatus Poribacteria bacterium]|nr:hypothetical protein [Candidatus Poribacteria bacterium]MYG06127.1 hypothetical protein [Candidatus Poribacteria bacterium]MYK21894.1 hypothetical protein [Candidatus Poribacteria bacterium]
MRFTYFLPGWAVVLGIAIVIGVTVFVYLRMTQSIHPRYRFLLIAMRVCAASILLCCLLAPVIIEKKDITPPTHLSILVDTSKSMNLVDASMGETSVSRLSQVNQLLFNGQKRFLQALRDRFEVHLYPFDTGLHQSAPLPKDLDAEAHPAFEPNGALTDIGMAIRETAAAWKGQNTAGILLITDGGHNSGRFPLEDVATLNVPVYAIGVGSVDPPKDIQVQHIDYTPIAYTNHESIIRVTVVQTGYAGKTTRLSLREMTRKTLVDTATLTFNQPQNATPASATTKQVVELKLTPQVEGNFQYTVELPVLDGELTEANNQKTFAVKVVKAKLNVFYLEGRPRWEYTYLKRALQRDPDIEATCALLLKNKSKRFPPAGSVLSRLDGYYPQTTPTSETPRFPETQTQLAKYDVLILGDLGEEHLTTTQQRAIVDFVEVQGKPVIFLPSRRMLGMNGLRNTELAQLLPIDIPRNGCRRHDTEFIVQPTPSGMFHPMLQLMDAQQSQASTLANNNAAAWRNMPALSRSFSGFRLRGGATPLMETGNEAPVLILQRAGLGKSLLIAAEGLWNWDFGVNTFVNTFKDTRYQNLYSRFWAQVLRWMATNTDDEKLHLTTEADSYAVGDTAKVTAYLYSEAYRATQTDAIVQFEVVPPEGVPFQLQIRGITETATDTGNLYSTQFSLFQNGTYRIRATARTANQRLGEDQIDIHVHPQLAELEAPQLNEDLLKELASETSGVYFAMADADALPQNVANIQNSVFVDAERELWSHPLILIMVVGLLGTEWFLRKRIGLT